MTSTCTPLNTSGYHDLIVCPGLSSPHVGKHRLVYDLLRSECAHRQRSVEIVTYPGQNDVGGRTEGMLTPSGAATAICAAVARHEQAGATYRILGLSFGCTMSLTAVASIPSLKCLERIVLWGPIPYGMMWRSFAKGTIRPDIGEGAVFPTRTKEEFWDDLTPLEHLVATLTLPLRLCVGSKDRFVPFEIVSYLKALAREEFHRSEGLRGTNDVQDIIVPECNHSVRANDANVEGYLQAVLQ